MRLDKENIDNKTIYGLLQNVPVTPTANCIVNVHGNSTSYEELILHIQKTVNLLNSWGISRNDRVAIVIPNGPEMAVAFLSICCGATSAPLNPEYRESEYAFYLQDLNAKALIILSGFDSPARKVATELNIPIIELVPHIATPGLFSLIGGIEQQAQQGGFCESEDIALVLHTSGTTSRPKIVPLRHKNICTSAHNIKNTLQLKQEDRCLNIMPLFHIHGLVGALLSSICSGASIVCTLGFKMNSFFTWMQLTKPTWYSAVPTMHQAILMAAEKNQDIIAQCSLRFIRSSSSSLPPSVLHALEETFSAPVIESYGMTEASHQMTSNPLPPQQHKPGSVGIAAGPKVAIMNEQNQFLPANTIGEIVIQGENVTSGYENNPEANRNAFTEAWFRTGDLGYFDEDNYFYIKGRVKEIINRGGEKISPREVDEALLENPSVQQAVAFAVPHLRLGEDIAAAVILKENQSITESEIRAFLFEKLADFKIPSQIIFIDKIPLGATGKMQRIGLAEKLAHLLTNKYKAPTNAIEEKLIAIWTNVLKPKESIGIHDNFFLLGGDSLLATQVVNRVNHEWQVHFPLRAIFQKPTISEQSVVIHDLKQNNKTNSITKTNQSIAPLSFQQEQLYYLHQVAEESFVSNRTANRELSGTVDIDLLETSLCKMIERHTTLRTCFIVKEDGIYQEICQDFSFMLPIVDLSTLLEMEQQTKANEIALAEGREIFLLHEPLKMRAKLLCFSQQKYLLLLTFHHIVFDRWSESVFFRDLATIYENLSQRIDVTLSVLPVQYIDYSIWQKQQNYEEHLPYWREYLGETPDVLKLPTDFIRTQKTSYKGKKIEFSLSTDFYKDLLLLANNQETTIFVVLFAVYNILLAEFANKDDLIIGVPFSGRDMMETEDIIGMFINTQPLRTKITKNKSFVNFLKEMQKNYLDAYSQQTPVQQILEKITVKESSNYSKLYQVLFVLENFPITTATMKNIALQPKNFDIGVSSMDLTLELMVVDGTIQGYFLYKEDLFKFETIQKCSQRFLELLQEVVINPQQKLQSLMLPQKKWQKDEVLSPEEKNKILYEWNKTESNFPKDKRIHELFEEQVDRFPNAIAVVCGEEQLTYCELNERANQLAHYLIAEKIKNEPILVIAERTHHVVINALALLKSGNIYVPVDSTTPLDRINTIIHDLKTTNVLADEKWQNILAPHMRVICEKNVDTYPTNNCNIKLPTQELCYILYTSGSTGKPKGVGISHLSLVNTIYTYIPFYQKKKMRELIVTSFAFDVSVRQIFSNLTNGNTIYIAQQKILEDIELLKEYIKDNKISFLNLTPSFFATITKLVDLNDCEELEYLILGAEKLMWSLIKSVSKKFQIWNKYGPTECCVDTHAYLIQKILKSPSIPIGKNKENTKTYLLDNHLQPVPIGAIGEIYIGGVGLARGYINNPGLTAERFVPNPFSEKGERIYKTGDLARYLPDGNVEFIGRKDHQVKVRGFRIELGEIEANLVEQENVNEAVVVVREDIPENKIIVAYITAKKKGSVDIKELRNSLKRKLPDYMIPSAFVVLDKIPLTPNGKIDRKALPKIENISSIAQKRKPRNFQERIIASAFAKVLKLENIGIDDNFFELGGHSLLIPLLFHHIEENMGKKIALAKIFENPTVASLAELCTWDDQKISQSNVIAIRKTGTKIPIVCIHSIEGNALNYYALAKELPPDYPFYVIEAPRVNNKFVEFNSVKETISFYIAELRKKIPQGPFYLAGHSSGGIFAYEMARQMAKEVRCLILFDTGCNRKDFLAWYKPHLYPHFCKYFFLWLLALTKDKNKKQRIKKLFSKPFSKKIGADLPNLDSNNLDWYNILPQETQNFISYSGNLIQQYIQHKPPYSGRICLFRVERSNDHPLYKIKKDYGWRKFSGSEVKIYYVNGDHRTLLYKEYANNIAKIIEQILSEDSNE